MSWFRRRIDKAKEERTVDFIFAELSGQDRRQVQSNKEYIRLSIEAMRIVCSREWASKYHGAVHVDLSYRRDLNGEVELQSVIAPAAFRGTDGGNAERIIMQNLPIVGPVPYEGELQLNLGLFSVKGEDLAAPYLDLLSGLTGKVGGFVSQAQALSEPLRAGMALLFGDVGSTELEIGVQTNWTNAQTGLYLLMRAPINTVDPKSLSYDQASRQVRDKDGKAVGDYPFVVLRVDAPEERPDWADIPELRQAWEAVRAADEKGDVAALKEQLRLFSVRARYSPDLVPSHARQLVEEITALTEGLFEASVPQVADRLGDAAANGPKSVRTSKPLVDLATLNPFGGR